MNAEAKRLVWLDLKCTPLVRSSAPPTTRSNTKQLLAIVGERNNVRRAATNACEGPARKLQVRIAEALHAVPAVSVRVRVR